MASATSVLLLFSIIIAICAISAAARPCKTIFFITSSSHQQILPKPNLQFVPNPNNSPRLTFFVTEIREFRRTTSLPRPMLFDRSDVVTSEPYFSASSSVQASIRERTMDIMSIVGAVLFGVACGALTAATMYLFWSLFVPRRFDFCSDSESGDEEDDVRVNKEGYSVVPPAAAAAATKAVPPSADEVDQVAAMK